MQILVTGGLGFIGSVLSHLLIDKGYSLVTLDNLSNGFIERKNQQAKNYIGDINDSIFLEKVFLENNITHIFHCAGLISISESVNDPKKYNKYNTQGTINLLQIGAKYKIKKIIFSSTAAVYGSPDSLQINENFALSPINPYGISKLNAEQFIKTFCKLNEINYTILRYFNVIGGCKKYKIYEKHNPMVNHLIPICLEVYKGNMPYLSIFGNDYNTPDGTCIRDYIHVEDLVDVHHWALENASNQIINVGYGKGFSVREVTNIFEKVTEKTLNKKISNRRLGDPAYLVADNSKLLSLYSWWKPRYSSLHKSLETVL